MNDPARRALAAGAVVVTIALTGAAFWLSYEHLHDVAADNGLGHDPARAWAWPATVDLFIVAGELLILRASLAGRVDPWAIVLASAGSLGSIALNVAGVRAGAPPLWYVVAAVPPVAALLAFGALMRQVHQVLAAPAGSSDETLAEAAGRAGPSVPAAQRDVLALRCPAVPAAVPPGVQLLPIVASTTVTVAAGEGRPYPRTPLPVPEAVPAGVRTLPIVARGAAIMGQRPTVAVPAQGTRTQPVTEYVPEPGDNSPPPPAEDLLTSKVRAIFGDDLANGRTPSIRTLREAYSIGQTRAQRVQRELGTPAAGAPGSPVADALFPVGS